MQGIRGQEKIEEIEIKTIRRLIAGIRNQYGYDFQDYALSAFKRRVLIFANEHGYQSIDLLIDRVLSDKDTFQHFMFIVTVRTTEMFRDPSMWRYLRDHVVPKLATRSKFSIWIPASSSGETLVSLIILLKEAGCLERADILATDISDYVISKSMTSVFNEKDMEVNIRNYQRFEGATVFSDYFDKGRKSVIFNHDYMNRVQFSALDLSQTKETPGTFDLVICRNQLIYYNHSLHEQVLNLLYQSMGKDSYLVLGSMERLQGHLSAGKLQHPNPLENIYRKI